MRVKLRHLFWKWFGQPDVPPQDFPILPAISEYSGRIYFPRFLEFNKEYRQNANLEIVAKNNNVTRERIRQCLWKSYWRYHNR